MTHCLFFAIKEDILLLTGAVEKDSHIKYTRTGNFSSHEIKGGIVEYSSAREIPGIGEASSESSVACDTFLVCNRDSSINIRVLPGDGRGERFCIDQLINPDSITFTPAGIWRDNIILSGRVATATKSMVSLELMKAFRRVVRKEFHRVQEYYVGPRALQCLKDGKRLTIAEQSSAEFDLTIS